MNQNQPNIPIQPPQFPSPSSQPWLLRYALLFGDYIRALSLILFWLVVGFLSLSAAWVALKAILWGARLVIRAVGGI